MNRATVPKVNYQLLEGVGLIALQALQSRSKSWQWIRKSVAEIECPVSKDLIKRVVGIDASGLHCR